MAWKLSRSIGVFAALAAAVGLVAGCGGGGATHGSGAPGTSAAAARAVNLRAGDVPGSVAGRVWEQGVAVRLEGERPPEDGPFDPWIERCDGGVTHLGAPEVVGFRSPDFTRGLTPAGSSRVEGTWSEVYTFGSAPAAKYELSVLAGARALACLERDGDTTVPGSETHLEASSHPIAPRVGIDEVSWSATPSSYHPPRRRYQDLLAFTAGRMLIVLHTIATPHPFQATLEARLIRLLYGRAMASETAAG